MEDRDMYRDPTEFRKRFARWKQGKPVYDGGRILKDTSTNAVFNDDGTFTDDTTRLFEDMVITPKGIRIKPEALPRYQEPWNEEKFLNTITLGGLNNTLPSQWIRRAYDAISGNLTADSWINGNSGIVPSWYEKEHPGYSAIANGLVDFWTLGGKQLLNHSIQDMAVAGKQLLTDPAPVMQYLRYPIGKIMYGMDAQFPTLYRKLKSPKLSFDDGMIQISNPESRFAYEATGEESPIITNFTYDAPVRSHGSGDWDSGFTLAIPGRKALLGKNVMSTEPSDLFTFGDNIKMNSKDVTLISGDADELQAAVQYGIKTKTSPKLQSAFPEDEGFSNGIYLTKPDYSKYAKEMELFAREVFGSPTKRDIDFMNYVLQPKIKGQVYNPNMLDYLIREGVEPFGDRIGNARLREYFLDPDRWANLLYDPATHAEANFRKANGIVLKKRIPLNKRKVK